MCALCVYEPMVVRRAPDPLELEVEVVMNHHVGTGSLSWVL